MILAIDAHNLRAGGGITHLTRLLRHAEASPEFERIYVFHSSAGAERLEAGLPSKVEVVREPLLDGRLPARTWWHHAVLRRRLEAIGADVLFSPGGLLPRSWPAKTKVVTMCRNMLPFQAEESRRYRLSRQRLRLAILKRIQVASFRRADAVVFLSAFARARIEPLTGPLRRAVIIPHGIDDDFRPLPTVQRASGEILYVSTIDVYKHQWHVVEALAILRRRGYDGLRLRLVGSPFAPALRRLRAAIEEHGLAAHVTIAGESLHSDLPRLYAGSAFAVFASSCENCPNILLEAMATGTAIVCSDRPPMPEFAGDAVAYCDPEQPASIAEAMERLLTQPAETERLGQLAEARATHYQWRESARATFSLLAQVARA